MTVRTDTDVPKSGRGPQDSPNSMCFDSTQFNSILVEVECINLYSGLVLPSRPLNQTSFMILLIQVHYCLYLEGLLPLSVHGEVPYKN